MVGGGGRRGPPPGRRRRAGAVGVGVRVWWTPPGRCASLPTCRAWPAPPLSRGAARRAAGLGGLGRQRRHRGLLGGARRGRGPGCDEVLMVTLGTGIGGGIISGGRLVEGANRYAGEFGHMVVDPHGPRCPCGKQGCWERFASGSGLGALGREMAIAGEAPRPGRLGRRRRRSWSAASTSRPRPQKVTVRPWRS